MAEYLGKAQRKGFFLRMLDSGVGAGSGKRLARNNLRGWLRNGMVLIGVKNQIGGAQQSGSNKLFQYIPAPSVPPSDSLDAASPQAAAEQRRYECVVP